MALTSENSDALREATHLVNRVAEASARGLRKVSILDGECEPVLPRGCTVLVRAVEVSSLRRGAMVMLRSGQYLRARQVTGTSREALQVVAPREPEVEETVDAARLVGEIVGYDHQGQRHLFELRSQAPTGLAGLLQKLGLRR